MPPLRTTLPTGPREHRCRVRCLVEGGLDLLVVSWRTAANSLAARHCMKIWNALVQLRLRRWKSLVVPRQLHVREGSQQALASRPPPRCDPQAEPSGCSALGFAPALPRSLCSRAASLHDQLRLEQRRVPSSTLEAVAFSLFLGLLIVHNGSGSKDHFCPRPCPTNFRWARPRKSDRRNGPHQCVVRARMHIVALSPPHVCPGRATGHSPGAATCKRTGSFT